MSLLWRKVAVALALAVLLYFNCKTLFANNIRIYQTENTSQNKNYSNSDLKKEIKIIMAKEEEKPKQNHEPRDIEQAAEFASTATGVRKDFLMGMLVVETSLGQNTGKCTYEEVENGANKRHERGQISHNSWQNFLRRNAIFKEIAQSLDYDYRQLKVSCNPPYAGTGGAMGVAQFMPDTWMEYKDRMAEILDKENPDPWDPKDAVTAMALKLSDIPGVVEGNQSAEMKAAKLYLSGSSSSRYNWYANLAIYWSKNYQRLMA